MRLGPPLCLLFIANALPAQRVEARFGALFSTTLAEDLGADPRIMTQYPAEYQGPVKLKLAPAPLASVAVLKSISPRTSIELAGTLAISKLQAESSAADWDVQDVSVASLTVGIRYIKWSSLAFHGGIGVTRFFSESSGIFREGNRGLPLLELGLSGGIPAGALPVRVGVRLQTHTFGTPALRTERASDGRVVRLLLQAGIGG
ncbi:MAG: hypothetical protein WEE89_02190 [Gemmatimonadota bacterium]